MSGDIYNLLIRLRIVSLIERMDQFDKGLVDSIDMDAGHY
jgi:hypothetical protein